MRTYEVLDNTVTAEDDTFGVVVVAVDEEGTSENPSTDSEQNTHDR